MGSWSPCGCAGRMALRCRGLPVSPHGRSGARRGPRQQHRLRRGKADVFLRDRPHGTVVEVGARPVQLVRPVGHRHRAMVRPRPAGLSSMFRTSLLRGRRLRRTAGLARDEGQSVLLPGLPASRRLIPARSSVEWSDHVTVYRWVQRFTRLLADAARFARHSPGDRWLVDGTYVKVSAGWW